MKGSGGKECIKQNASFEILVFSFSKNKTAIKIIVFASAEKYFLLKLNLQLVMCCAVVKRCAGASQLSPLNFNSIIHLINSKKLSQ